MRRILLKGLKLFNRLGYNIHRSEDHAFQDILCFFTEENVQAKIVFDVGANKGSITEEFLTYFPESDVHTFEAIPELVAIQKEKFKDNNRVYINECAISDSEGIVKFNVNHIEDTSSLLKSDDQVIPARYGKVYQTKKSIDVTKTTIDSYCLKNKISSIDLLKMDIQGAELLALKGSKNMLKEGNIKLLYLETLFIPLYKDQALFSDVFTFLSANNYSMAFIYNLNFNFKTGRLLHSDTVFIHNSVKDQYPKISI